MGTRKLYELLAPFMLAHQIKIGRDALLSANGVAPTLETIQTIKALEMALDHNKGWLSGLIHHSDRGIQYCSSIYVKLLQAHEIQISMTEKGDPLENSIAERVNGISKRNTYPVTRLRILLKLKNYSKR